MISDEILEIIHRRRRGKVYTTEEIKKMYGVEENVDIRRVHPLSKVRIKDKTPIAAFTILEKHKKVKRTISIKQVELDIEKEKKGEIDDGQ